MYQTITPSVCETKNVSQNLKATELFPNEKFGGSDYSLILEMTDNSNIKTKLLINPHLPIISGTIVAGSLNYKPFVKRIIFTKSDIVLRAVDDDEEDILVDVIYDFSIWGVVSRRIYNC